MIIYLEAYDYDVCAWYRQVIALWVANEAISAGDENSSVWWMPRALNLCMDSLNLGRSLYGLTICYIFII